MSVQSRNKRNRIVKRFPFPGKGNPSLIGLILLLVLCFSSGHEAMGGDQRTRGFDVALGAGTNVLNGLSTRQLLIVPALTWPVKGIEPLWFASKATWKQSTMKARRPSRPVSHPCSGFSPSRERIGTACSWREVRAST